MITLIVNVKIKAEFLDEYIILASKLTKESRQRAGCISYVFNQNIDKPTEFALFEQWESQSHLDEHLRALIILLGEPESGGLLPKKLMGMYETAEPVSYTAIEE